MDRTALFKATVKTIRTKNKALGVKEATRDILGSKRQKSEFGTRAKDVLVNITKLREFLLKHQKDYISPFSHLSLEVSSMTDEERDQIDTDAETYMRTCSVAIQTLKNEALQQKRSDQVTTHRDTVLEMLGQYLKVVCKLYSEQRAIRVKRVVDKKRISRLQPDQKRMKREANATEELVSNSSGSNVVEATSKESKSQPQPLDLGPPPGEDEELTPEEVQMFEMENKRLFTEMNSLVDEVRQIEGRVVEISQLQEIFSEKVLHQSTQIDRIYETAVGTTENVKGGNEQIREAIKNNASFRVWILFFLVMCSLSLLFLDWYN
ncbi:syntaxin-18-like [Orbicella faveolata]|uniref:syntaxin-18-like n=1 Tax=Orbicella faveolata TaxID=48498 RepID=UPI0009E47AC0|nr:syntaxin-18-like [Orbicella faveolata]